MRGIESSNRLGIECTCCKYLRVGAAALSVSPVITLSTRAGTCAETFDTSAPIAAAALLGEGAYRGPKKNLKPAVKSKLVSDKRLSCCAVESSMSDI